MLSVFAEFGVYIHRKSEFSLEPEASCWTASIFQYPVATRSGSDEGTRSRNTLADEQAGLKAFTMNKYNHKNSISAGRP